ncbi:hypothetical protein [Pseudomonas hunanensis]|uniref:hypothetical protein n=1 Tax=Pseudomonas hunanensis TaxID=1247546 RepID=UPI0030DA9877
MTAGVEFAQVFEQTRERLRDPVQHFCDLDLYLPNLSEDNAKALRLALVELLEIGIGHNLAHPIAHGLASMYAADRYDQVSIGKWGTLGIITGVEAAVAVRDDQAGRLRALVEKVDLELWRKEFKRLKRRMRK